MFAIHYYMDKTLVAVEGPIASKADADTYLENRSHYLEFSPRIVSMNAPRIAAIAACPTRVIFERQGAALPARPVDRHAPQPVFA